MRKTLFLALGMALTVSTPLAQADVRFSGFGQAIAGRIDDPSVRIASRQYEDRWTMDQDSLLGVQIDADVSDRINVVGQVMVQAANDWEPELTWAYAHVRLTDSLSTKIGRQRLPLYRYSDYLDVGNAYPWVRPTSAMYNQPWTNADGISLALDNYIGENWYSQAQVLYGSFDGDVRGDDQDHHAKLDKIVGGVWEMEYKEWLSLRAAYFQADVSLDLTQLDPLLEPLRAYGLEHTADMIDFQKDKGSFKSLGARIERNNWLLVGEYAQVHVEDTLLDNADRRDWYLSAGRQIGKVMPHVTYGKRVTEVNQPLVNSVPMAHPLYPSVAGLALYDQLDERFVSAGVRWDLNRRWAVKADWTRMQSGNPLRPGGTLLSAGVVFTF